MLVMLITNRPILLINQKVAFYNDWTALHKYSSTNLVIHSSDTVTIHCLPQNQWYRFISKQVVSKNHTQASAVPQSNHTSSVSPYLQLSGTTNPVVHVTGPWSPLINNSRLSEPMVVIPALYSMQTKSKSFTVFSSSSIRKHYS